MSIVLSYLTLWVQRSSSQAQLPGGARSLGASGLQPARGRCSHLYIGPAASGTLNREDWGLTWNLPVDSGGVQVSKDIRIEIELEAVLQQ